MARTAPASAPSAGSPSGDVPADLTERLRALRDALLTGLVERDIAIRLALIATLSGEHLLLIGPPGTAKSLIARRLRLALRGSVFFERLLTRFTVPEELFGPLSIKGLEEDRYLRLTEAYLPTASVAFLDEIFKANSAILNALLTLLNEREFDNGTARETTPLLAVIGASNELGDAEELAALYDRFLLRLHVGPVSSAGFEQLLALRGESSPKVSDSLKLSREDLAAVQAAALEVEVPGDVTALLADLRDWCTAEHILVSDRRWRKVVKLLQVSALTNGRSQVSIWDCWLLQHCLWDKPEDREKIYAWYAKRVGANREMQTERLTRYIVALEGQLERDSSSPMQARDEQGRLLFLGPDGTVTTSTTGSVQAHRGDKPLYLSPSRASTNSDYDYTEYHITDRTNSRRGYTAAELDKIYVNATPGNYRNTLFKSWSDRAAYLADPANRLMVEERLRPHMEPMRHKEEYVQVRLREIDELQQNVSSYATWLSRHIAGLEAEIRSHLWLLHGFAAPALQSLQETQHSVSALQTRIEALQKGFHRLPREVPVQFDGADLTPPVSKRRARSSRSKAAAAR